MGVHVLDVLVRPVEAIPEGQGGQLVEEIRITAGGLGRRHGADAGQARRRGAQRRRDRHRRARRHAARRCSSATASTPRCWCAATTCRPRRASCRSAPTASARRSTSSARTRTYGRRRRALGRDRRGHAPAPRRRPSSWAARRRRRSCRFAREHGVVTSADILAPGEQAAAILDWIAPALEHLDYLLPNDEQVLGFTGADDLEAGCRALLERGVGCVAATSRRRRRAGRRRRRGRAGAGVRDRRRRHDRLRRRLLRRLPARALARPQRAATPPSSAAPPRRSSRRGWAPTTATFDLAAADAFAARTPTR